MQERRKYKRFTIEKVGADYRMVDPKFWAVFSSQGRETLCNISLGGVSFSSSDVLPKDSFLSLKLKLGEMIRIGELYGRIVRIRKLDRKKYEIGVNFSWWGKDEDKVDLAHYMEDNEKPL